ncbi:glycosyltransferase involved in cell wall biosynthesis [Salinibacter ruber]|nr:glycosyltransferase involved in cell wall biosynthesis [Salinibacter ruber]
MAREGHEVVVTSPSEEVDGVEKQNMEWGTLVHLGVEPLHEGVNPMWILHRRPSLYSQAKRYLEAYQPDVVFGHSLPRCASILEAASDLKVPIVFSVLDFSHLCGRTFLVDSEGDMCSGPESVEKCRSCLQHDHPTWRQVGMRVAETDLGRRALRGFLGSARAESFNLKNGIKEAFSVRHEFQSWVTTWLATSRHVADMLERYGVSGSDIRFTPTFGLEDDRMDPSPGPPPFNGRPVNIGYFGRISPEKGVGMLADVLGEVSADNFEWTIISYSVDDSTKAELRTRSGLPKNHIHFVEGVSGAALNDHIAKLDVCVVPSRWPETGPLTLLEAMAQNVPCICNDLSANARVIDDGVNGRVFETGNKASLRAAIQQVLDDPSLLNKWRENVDVTGERSEKYVEALCSALKNAVQ